MQRNDRNTMEAGVESIFKMLAQRVDDKQMRLVRNAYELAAEAHKEQKRKTGEPYIIHPIAVARIIAEELELGANPVMAAFLHDVVEDTKYTIEDIRDRFGEDVAFLVGVVTKQKKSIKAHSIRCAIGSALIMLLIFFKCLPTVLSVKPSSYRNSTN